MCLQVIKSAVTSRDSAQRDQEPRRTDVYGTRSRHRARRVPGRTPSGSRGRVPGAETRCPWATSVGDPVPAYIALDYVNNAALARADLDPVARVAKGDSRVPVARIWGQTEKY